MRETPRTHRKPLFRTADKRMIISRDLVMPIHPQQIAQSLETVFASMPEREEQRT